MLWKYQWLETSGFSSRKIFLEFAGWNHISNSVAYGWLFSHSPATFLLVDVLPFSCANSCESLVFFTGGWLPSGSLVCYGKSQFFIEANGLKRFFFSSYVSLPEGLWFPADFSPTTCDPTSDARQLDHRQRGVAQPRIRPKVLATRGVNMDGSSSDLPQ